MTNQYMSNKHMEYLRVEVLDRLLCIMHSCNTYNCIPDINHKENINHLLENFTLSQTYTIINDMIKDKTIINYPKIYKNVKAYYNEINELMSTIKFESNI